MSRSLSLTARRAANAQETGEVFLHLLTIDHADLASPLRFVDNTEDVTSRGNTFLRFPFEITLPDEDAENIPNVTLRIDNVDRQIVQAVRSLTSAPTITLEIVLASDPDTLEAGPFDFTLRNARYDAQTVDGTLAFEDILNTAIPGDLITPQTFPGVFA